MTDVMEKYADWLDDLEKSNPAGYSEFMSGIQQQMQAESGAGAPDLEKFTQVLAQAAAAAQGKEQYGKDPSLQFPGNKVMETHGVKEKQEGEMISVEPGFVIKTKNQHTGVKVFVNFCCSAGIKNFSKQIRLNEQGEEQEGMHIPLSVGYLHLEKDKSGKDCDVYDVAVNVQVIEDCNADPSGTFRNFLCELAMEYIEKKHQVKLDPRYKRPKLNYKGKIPPPQHYIRKDTAPVIEDITSSSKDGPRSQSGAAKISSSSKKQQKKKPHKTMRVNYFTRDKDGQDTPCERLPAVEGGPALSSNELQDAGQYFKIQVYLPQIHSLDSIQAEIASEMLVITAEEFFNFEAFLPYPMETSSVQATFDSRQSELMILVKIDKQWNTSSPDPGSNAWLLAEALASNDNESQQEKEVHNPQEQQDVADRFHLSEMPASKPTTFSNAYDPVQDDEELPEDKFHKNDLMSQHILEQRRTEREQKSKQADEERKQRKKEQQEKMKLAEAEGKTWKEMYPNEPETTFIDMEDFKKERDNEKTQGHLLAEEMMEMIPTEAAQAAAAVWAEDLQQKNGPQIANSIAFELI